MRNIYILQKIACLFQVWCYEYDLTQGCVCGVCLGVSTHSFGALCVCVCCCCCCCCGGGCSCCCHRRLFICLFAAVCLDFLFFSPNWEWQGWPLCSSRCAPRGFFGVQFCHADCTNVLRMRLYKLRCVSVCARASVTPTTDTTHARTTHTHTHTHN